MRKIKGSEWGFFATDLFFPSPRSAILSEEKQHNCQQLRKLQKWKLLCTGPVPGIVYDLWHQVIQLISKGNHSLLEKSEIFGLIPMQNTNFTIRKKLQK